jgi:hypothetical protein
MPAAPLDEAYSTRSLLPPWKPTAEAASPKRAVKAVGVGEDEKNKERIR